MKKTILILALLFTTCSASLAGYDYMYLHAFDDEGQCTEKINSIYGNINSYASPTISGAMNNEGNCSEASFFYAVGGTGSFSISYYYPFFSSSPSFIYYLPYDYYSTYLIGMDVYGADASVTIVW